MTSIYKFPANKIILTLFLSLLISCNTDSYNIFIEIDNAYGIDKGTKIFYKGKEIGKINEINIFKNRVLAMSEINDEIKIPENSKFEIISTDLFGTKAFEIICNKYSKPYLKNNDTVKSYINDNTKIDSLFINIKEVIDDIKDTLK